MKINQYNSITLNVALSRFKKTKMIVYKFVAVRNSFLVGVGDSV